MDKNQPIVIQESDKIQTIELTTEDSIKFNEFIIDIDLIKKLPVNSKLTATDFDDTIHLSILDYDKSFLDCLVYIKCSIKANGKFVILNLKITEPVEPVKPPIQDTRISTQAIDEILAEISKLKNKVHDLEQNYNLYLNQGKNLSEKVDELDERAERHNNRLGVIENKLSI